MKYDVVALGELLIDFTSHGFSEQGNILYEANPGGAPANVLAMLSKMQKRTALIGKVGDDTFAKILIKALNKCKIDQTGLHMTNSAHSTLAFVSNDENGEREFSFLRDPGADLLLEKADISEELIRETVIFHFGSLSLTSDPARDATKYAVDLAKKYKKTISFDPNLRPLLWKDLNLAKEQILWGCGACDILKLAEEELYFLTDKKTLDEGIDEIRNLFPNIRLFIVTLGKTGAEAIWSNIRVFCPGFHQKNTIDTTGAGDTFFGSCLALLLDLDLERPDRTALFKMLEFANAAASLITTKKGALLSMPEKDEVEAVIKEPG